MTPSPDPYIFAVAELVLAVPVLVALVIYDWRQRRAVRRAQIDGQQPTNTRSS